MIKLSIAHQPEKKRWDRNLELRVFDDPTRKHRQLVSLLPSKVEKFARGEHGFLESSHWEVPIVDLSEVLRRYQRNEILCTQEVRDLIADYDYNMIHIDDLPRVAPRPLPAGCPIILDEHQLDYQCWAPDILRPFNVWDTGIGKSLGTLSRAYQQGFNRLLIITILNNTTGWPVDIRKLFGINTKTLIYQGKDRKNPDLIKATYETNFLITTFECAPELDLTTNIFDSFIIDEANLLFNFKTNRSKKFEPIFDATWRTGKENCQLATATPVGNRIETVWNLMRWRHPLTAGTLKAFSDRHMRREEVMTAYKDRVTSTGICYKKEVTYAKRTSTINKEELQRKLTSRMAVKFQEEVANWSEEISLIKCGMDLKQKGLYEQLRNETIESIHLFDRDLKLEHAWQRMLRCLQAGEGIFNFEENDLFELEEAEYGSGKFEKLVELLPAHKKAIVLSRFRKMPLLLFKKFYKNAVIHIGDTHKDDKRLARWAFQGCSDSVELAEFTALAKKRNFHLGPGEANIFLMTIDSRSSAGMNLPICPIQYVTSFSLNHVDNKQATGRIRRKTQQSDIIRTKYMISGGTCERSWLIYMLKIASEARSLISGEKGLDRDVLSIFLHALQNEIED